MRSIDLSTPSIPSLSQKNLSPLDYNAKGLQRSSTKTGGSALHLQRGGKEGEGRGIPLIRASMIISSRIYISFFSSFPRSKPPSTAPPPLVATRISFEKRRKEKRGRKEGRKKGRMDNEGVNRAWKDSRREGEGGGEFLGRLQLCRRGCLRNRGGNWPVFVRVSSLPLVFFSPSFVKLRK